MDFDYRLEQALCEMVQPGIDHHLEHGVTVDSYREVLQHIYEENLPHLEQSIADISKYLNYVGYDEDDYKSGARDLQELQLLARLEKAIKHIRDLCQRLEGAPAGMDWAKRSTWPQTKEELSFESTVGYVKSDITNIRGLTSDLIRQLNMSGYQPPPDIFNGLNSTIQAIEDDLSNVGHHFKKPAGELNLNNKKILQKTLEAELDDLLPRLTPVQIQALMSVAPEHGPKQVARRISSLVTPRSSGGHGLGGVVTGVQEPHRSRLMHEISAITKYWPMTAADVMKVVKSWGNPPDNNRRFANFLRGEGAALGIR